MTEFFLLMFVLSLVLALVALALYIYVAVFRFQTFYALPRALRFYLIINCFPFILCIILVSIYQAASFLIYGTVQSSITDYLRYGVVFSSEQIRFTLFTIIAERIIATVYLENYTVFNSQLIFRYFIIASYGSTMIYVAFTVYCMRVPGLYYLFDFTNYTISLTHLIILAACTILYILNKRIYKLAAYQMTLRRRYQVFENVKVLTFIFPSVLIYSLLAHLGPIVAIIIPITWPSCLYHIFYNLPFLLMALRHTLLHRKTKVADNNNSQILVSTVENAFGKSIPANVSTDNYFRELQNTWK